MTCVDRETPGYTTGWSSHLAAMALSVAWWIMLGVLLFQTARALEYRITWYLSPPQFGNLTFARDLLRGRVFHDWPPLEALRIRLPPRADVLSQAYLFDHGRLYSRYAPGFPMLLAGWSALFGEDRVHYLNATLFLILVVLMVLFQQRLFHSRWRALMGAAILLAFWRNEVSLWALTPVRDLSAHVAALAGLVLLVPWGARRLVPGRAAVAGLALGFAGSIRPDCLLYLFSAALLAGARWWRERLPRRTVPRALAAGILGVTLGLSPSLALYGVAGGNPFRPTESMEVEGFIGGAPSPSPGWHGGTAEAVEGGRLRLANLPRTLPRNLREMRNTYGTILLAAAVWGACVSLVLRPIVFLATVPYVVTALSFYSCWAWPNALYLIGVHVLIAILVVEGIMGTFDLVRCLSRLQRKSLACQLAAVAGAALLLSTLLASRPDTSPGGTLSWIVPALAGAGLLVATCWPERRVAGIVAPVLGLTLGVAAISYEAAALKHRASFQGPQMQLARENLRRLVDLDGVVITTEDVGRPAENIEYYSGTPALYLTDLKRWQISLHDAAMLLNHGGMHPYLFIRATEPRREELLAELSGDLQVERVAAIPAPEAMAHFVAAAFHRGVAMELFRVTQPSALAGG